MKYLKFTFFVLVQLSFVFAFSNDKIAIKNPKFFKISPDCKSILYSNLVDINEYEEPVQINLYIYSIDDNKRTTIGQFDVLQKDKRNFIWIDSNLVLIGDNDSLKLFDINKKKYVLSEKTIGYLYQIVDYDIETNQILYITYEILYDVPYSIVIANLNNYHKKIFEVERDFSKLEYIPKISIEWPRNSNVCYFESYYFDKNEVNYYDIYQYNYKNSRCKNILKNVEFPSDDHIKYLFSGNLIAYLYYIEKKLIIYNSSFKEQMVIEDVLEAILFKDVIFFQTGEGIFCYYLKTGITKKIIVFNESSKLLAGVSKNTIMLKEEIGRLSDKIFNQKDYIVNFEIIKF